MDTVSSLLFLAEGSIVCRISVEMHLPGFCTVPRTRKCTSAPVYARFTPSKSASLPADDQIVEYKRHLLSRIHAHAPIIHALLETPARAYQIS